MVSTPPIAVGSSFAAGAGTRCASIDTIKASNSTRRIDPAFALQNPGVAPPGRTPATGAGGGVRRPAPRMSVTQLPQRDCVEADDLATTLQAVAASVQHEGSSTNPAVRDAETSVHLTQHLIAKLMPHIA
jgi:hypothetical protein